MSLGSEFETETTVLLHIKNIYCKKIWCKVFSDECYIGNIARIKSVNWKNMENIFIITNFQTPPKIFASVVLLTEKFNEKGKLINILFPKYLC